MLKEALFSFVYYYLHSDKFDWFLFCLFLTPMYNINIPTVRIYYTYTEYMYL